MTVRLASFGPRYALLALVLTACGGGSATQNAAWPAVAQRWYERAAQSYKDGDFDDAATSIESALRSGNPPEEARLLAGRIALGRLEFDKALAAVAGLESSAAHGVRGRAYWYEGKIDKAADELERLVSNPEVHDAWATDVAKLARRGTGRRPFEITGAMVAQTEMPHTGTVALIVPLELNGEPALGLVATGIAETVVDASKGTEPSWISLRFGERIEVHDVPAFAKDLSGVSKQVNAPIRVLLGINLLRRLNPTFDFAGGQFVVRNYAPPPPPHTTTLNPLYIRGGGMLVRAQVGSQQAPVNAALFVDTMAFLPIALDEGGWKKAGVALSSLKPVPNTSAKQGIIPFFRLGALDLPNMYGFASEAAVKEREQNVDLDLDGVLGSGLFAAFRATLTDSGRTLWLEELPPDPFGGRPLFPPAEADLEDDATETPDPSKPGGIKPTAPKPPAAGAPAAGSTPAPTPPRQAPAPAPKPPAAKTP